MKSFQKYNLLLAVILLYNCSNAIDVKGFYVTLKNDTIQATLKIPYLQNVSIEPNFEKMQNSVEYYVNDKEKKVLLPTNCKAFGFYFLDNNFETDTIIFVSKNKTTEIEKLLSNDENQLFLRLVIKGKLSLYDYFYKSESFSAGFSGNIPQQSSVLRKKMGYYFGIIPPDLIKR